MDAERDQLKPPGKPPQAAPADGKPAELTVCDVMGDWGLYQWSLTLFGIIYSALFSTTVVVGPIWTPDLHHLCVDAERPTVDFSGDPFECQSNLANGNQTVECSTFIYDADDVGQVLTNSFHLVCSRRWLRSFVSSSALLGMLVSSLTLGLLSDRLGRIACARVAFVISISATVGAILSPDYLTLNVCVFLMSYAQVGVGNAICTLVMEATSPRFRFVPVFEYGFGWGLGMLATPLLNAATRNFRHFFAASLALQLLMLLWFRFGVHESIRWLLSDGSINKAQIELQRACRLNGVKNGAHLAHKIAQVQVQQVRKASSVLERKLSLVGGRLVAGASADEVAAVAAAAKRSLLPDSDGSQPGVADAPTTKLIALSPTLLRQSFSLAPDEQLVGCVSSGGQTNAGQQQQPQHQLCISNSPPELEGSDTLTAQALAQLAVKYGRALERQEEGACFLIQMFHRKLWRLTALLMLLSLMVETSYYGLLQANRFVGSNVELNYVAGALGEWLAAVLFMLVLWAFSREKALIGPVLLSSLICLAIAATFQLVPDKLQVNLKRQLTLEEADQTLGDPLDSIVLTNDSASIILDDQAAPERHRRLVELRDQLNFWLVQLGKLSLTVCIQVSATVALEAYPNNLRQSGSGAIVLVGRMVSIAAPFLFSDDSNERLLFKLTLVVMAALGLLVSVLVPSFLRANKDKELCDRLDDIEEPT